MKKLVSFFSFFLALFLFSSSYVFAANPLRDDVLEALETSDTYTEPDGLTKWEKKSDGRIIKYHFGRNEINQIYYPNGKHEIYSIEGVLLVEEDPTGKQVIYNPETGEIENIIDGERVIYYKDGERSRVEDNSSDGAFGNNVAVSLGDGMYRITKDGTVYLIEASDDGVVMKVRHSTSFSKDYEIENRNDMKTEHIVIERLLSPVNDEIFYEKVTNYINGEAESVKKTSEGFKYSLQRFLIGLFNKPTDLEKAQMIFDKNFGN